MSAPPAMSDRVGRSTARLRPVAVVVGVLLVADLIAVGTVHSAHHDSAAAPPQPGAVSAPASGPTTGALTTTSSPPAPVGVSPLTGLPTTDAARVMRPALSVKIDNAPDARPQSGLDAADIVAEELVEGGLTRFFATFQSQDAPAVGPIRSARPVDTDLLTELGGGLFAFSGGARAVIDEVRADSGAVLLTPVAGDGVFSRSTSRRAPANLYASTARLYAEGAARAPNLGPPPALFQYSASPPAGAQPATTASVTFSGSAAASWTWDAAAGSYDRGQDGAPATEVGGAPITAADVVILSVSTVGSGDYDVLGHENPLSVLTGSGTCWVLRDGVLIQGMWERASATVAVRLIGVGGTTIDLHPGRTWLELLPAPTQPVFG